MRRPIIFLFIAGVAAALAAIVVYSALKKKDAQIQQATVKSVPVAVAARDLPLGSKLDPGAIKLVRWPRDNVPEGAASDPRPFLGAIVKDSIVADEPIVATKLFTGEKTSGVMPLLIPEGMRAMSVPVDEVADIAGFVQPHMRVDVLAAISSAGNNTQNSRAKVVLEDVEVLAIAQTIEHKQDDPQVVKVVTLLVTTEQAERLALASREGTLRLAMRGYNDDKIVLTQGVDINSVMQAYSSAPAAVQFASHRGRRDVPPPPPPSVEVQVMRNGKDLQTVRFTPGVHGTELHAAPAPEAKPEPVKPGTTPATNNGFPVAQADPSTPGRVDP